MTIFVPSPDAQVILDVYYGGDGCMACGVSLYTDWSIEHGDGEHLWCASCCPKHPETGCFECGRAPLDPFRLTMLWAIERSQLPLPLEVTP